MSESPIHRGPPPGRSNEAWVAALRDAGAGSQAAAEELRDYLVRVLAKVLRARSLREEDLADLAQEALLRIVESLDRYRGDAAFTTWATAVATRVAFTELRRRNVRERGREDFEAVRRLAAEGAGGVETAADESVAQRDLLRALDDAIHTRLSERQRTAVLAELRGLPTVEIAARLDTNQNALYKLVHDARKKLRRALLDRGYDAESLGGVRPEVAR